MTEYWLQKKTIGGWSMVTWYADLEQAKANYVKCYNNGKSGYSWRLCEVNVLFEQLLEEVVEVEAPVLEQTPAGIKGYNKADGHWGDASGVAKPVTNGGWSKAPDSWGDHAGMATKSSWSDIPSSSASTHGLSGSVWMVNHKEKKKCRVPANEVELLEGLGYERGGPKTKFRE